MGEQHIPHQSVRLCASQGFSPTTWLGITSSVGGQTLAHVGGQTLAHVGGPLAHVGGQTLAHVGGPLAHSPAAGHAQLCVQVGKEGGMHV